MAVFPGILPGRGIASVVHDALAADPCLFPLLDQEFRVAHGTEDWCDEQVSSHELPGIRRYQQPWPGHFYRAVIAVGAFSRSPFRNGRVLPNLEEWVFTIQVFVRDQVLRDDGTAAGPGDLYALDIYDHVVRILGWDQEPPPGQLCGPDFIVHRRSHLADAFPLQWVGEKSKRWWQIGTRFVWWVQSRGLVAPPPCIPCGQ